MSVVWEGRMHLEDRDRTHLLDFRRGDLYLYGTVWPMWWEVSNPGRSEARELVWVAEQDRVRPDLALSSSTGKTGGLLGPMSLP